ncbi:Concanavalin A-like lectin/glucanases superfamily [Penicillium hetheringtonii]|uniref:chitinase n=1 Tax=Penicillium hetheringtonii TaxID=911720 RepID=A0AAD6D972_9EURO|nr:Concanavalin A-like lectin/glucanases superfamily [Penicillium hetheringtonii]
MFVKSYLNWVVVGLAGAQLGAAQTYTSCNPLKKTCPADTGLNKWQFNTDFTSGSSAFSKWNTTAGTVESTSLGAKFTIAEQGDAPTIETDFYIFFGRVDVRMKAANGTGIISTAVMESDDLDEIDWEQISTYDTSIETDYFGKGNTTSYDRATTVTVSSPEDTFHTYSVDWTSSRIEWLLDGEVVRTLEYADAVSGKNYPQTPMRIKIGIWAGGDSDNSEGTIEWAGGETDYTAGPFTMYLDSVNITNYNPAQAYKYTDKTGSYTSIKASNSTTSTNLSHMTSSSISSSSKASSSSVSKASSSASSAASASTSSNLTSSAPLSMYSSLLATVVAAFAVGAFQI